MKLKYLTDPNIDNAQSLFDLMVLASIFHEGVKAFRRTRESGWSRHIASTSAPLLRR